MNIFDPTMTVPPDVAQAADKLTTYFADRDITVWRLNGVASRTQLEQAEADRDAFEAAGESARERLALRMEELQQAVQARLAAEAKVAQLQAALEAAKPPLELYRAYGWSDRAGVIATVDAAIAKVKGGAA